MSTIKKPLFWITILCTALFGFIAGEIVGGRYALMREMQLQAEILARHGPILANCKTTSCDKNFQKILIQANDTAMQQLVLLETTNILNRSFYYIVWPVIFSTFTNSSAMPSEQFKNYYKKLGCGLNDVICSL